MRDEVPSVPPPASGRAPWGGPTPAFKPRNIASVPERLLWQQLRNRTLGYKFSRQMPVGPYFADFLFRECHPIIELDGDTHDRTTEYDARRDDYYRTQGYQILRFSNADVMGNREGVIPHINTTLAKAHLRPLPQAGGEPIA